MAMHAHWETLLSVVRIGEQHGQLPVGLELWAGNCQSPVLKVGSCFFRLGGKGSHLRLVLWGPYMFSWGRTHW